jgi:hypothetical protein
LKYEAVWFLSGTIFLVFHALIKMVITYPSIDALEFPAAQG